MAIMKAAAGRLSHTCHMKNKPREDAMPAASYRVARLSGNQVEVLGEFSTHADAIDMADRAKYMQPFVLRMAEDGEVDVLDQSGAMQRMRDSIMALLDAEGRYVRLKMTENLSGK